MGLLAAHAGGAGGGSGAKVDEGATTQKRGGKRGRGAKSGSKPQNEAATRVHLAAAIHDTDGNEKDLLEALGCSAKSSNKATKGSQEKASEGGQMKIKPTKFVRIFEEYVAGVCAEAGWEKAEEQGEGKRRKKSAKGGEKKKNSNLKLLRGKLSHHLVGQVSSACLESVVLLARPLQILLQSDSLSDAACPKLIGTLIENKQTVIFCNIFIDILSFFLQKHSLLDIGRFSLCFSRFFSICSPCVHCTCMICARSSCCKSLRLPWTSWREAM